MTVCVSFKKWEKQTFKFLEVDGLTEVKCGLLMECKTADLRYLADFMILLKLKLPKFLQHL